MAQTTTKNLTVKALKSHLASEKNLSRNALIEYEMAFQKNSNRGHVYDQHELLELYNAYGENDEGCSKAVHLHNHVNGEKFKYIVVKRHQKHGWMPNPNGEHSKCTGNQLIDEINCWQEFAEREESDYLCPVLKFFTSKSDKVKARSEKMKHNVIIIAQRAVEVSDAWTCCCIARDKNLQLGIIEDADERYEKLERFAKKQGWRDAMNNPGNSGVIYDYSQNKYKAVFIDYAL